MTADLPRPDPTRGVFETLLVVDGRPVELDAHLARLHTSARELFGAPTAARIAGPARALAESEPRGLALGRLRISLAADDDGALDLSARVQEVDRADLFPTARDRLAALTPVAVPGGLGAHKWADRRLLEAAAVRLDGARPLLIDEPASPEWPVADRSTDGATNAHVLEADRANVFAVRDGALLTPPLDGRILPGVTRAVTIVLALEHGLHVAEQLLTLSDLATADEAFLTGSVRGIEPIHTVADEPLPHVGPVTKLLATALRDRWIPS